jgi:hypothetical protein
VRAPKAICLDAIGVGGAGDKESASWASPLVGKTTPPVPRGSPRSLVPPPQRLGGRENDQGQRAYGKWPVGSSVEQAENLNAKLMGHGASNALASRPTKLNIA